MKQFMALLRLQLLTRYADLKPRNMKNAFREKKGRSIGMMIGVTVLVIYLGVILYIIETKMLDFLGRMGWEDMLPAMAVTLATVGTLVMAFFFVMSSLYLGRDSVFLASMPVKTRTILGAKLTQVWLSETLIDAVILLPACILYGGRTGADAGFYLRMVLTWLMVAILPISIAALFSALLIRISVLWKHREAILTVGGIVLFAGYMFLMMNVGQVTNGNGQEFIESFMQSNAERIRSLTKMFPPAEWAAEGMIGDWGKLALYAAASAAAAAVVIGLLGVFYRKLSLLQGETAQVSSKKGIQKGAFTGGSAFRANVKRELKMILRVPSYATNILPIALLPAIMTIFMGLMVGRNIGENGESLQVMLQRIDNSAIVMGILAAVMAYMSGMNPALSTAVTREGRGHGFLTALPVSAQTLIKAKFTVGFALSAVGIIGAGIAVIVMLPIFATEAIMAVILCLLFCYASDCLALSRDVKHPKLDWVTEQEAVKQNFGVLISMLISWAVLGLLAALMIGLILLQCNMIVCFAVLCAVLLGFAYLTHRILQKNVVKYYFAQ